MTTLLALGVAAGLATLPLIADAPAQAAAANADAARVQVGRVPLTSLGVSQAVAQQQIGTTARADPVNGPGVTTIPAGIIATSARA